MLHSRRLENRVSWTLKFSNKTSVSGKTCVVLNKTPSPIQVSDESFDLIIQIWIRFIIAFSSLIVFFIAPIKSPLPGELTQMLLIYYCLYSACIVFVYDMRIFRELASHRVVHWIDVIYFACLITLTGGSDSIFFFFFFFPIIVASFSWGFAEGLKVTIATVIAYSITGLIIFAPSNSHVLGEIIMRPIYLVVFGLMFAYWGGGRITLGRKLKLLQEISTNWNPRFGIDHAIMVNLARLVEFYEASRAILVLEHADLSPKYVMHTSDPHKLNSPQPPREIAETTARELLMLPDSLALIYENPSANNLSSFSSYIAYDVNTMETSDRYFSECKILSTLLDDESFISVPYRQQGVTSGRMYLVAVNNAFSRTAVAFSKQVADAISSVVENMQLIEDLVSEAGGQERHRISLDVHDTTIQPYIGLTLALDALSREFVTDAKLTTRIVEIIDMANMTIQDLRSYKDTLREKSLMRGEFLISAIRNQVERLQRFYGIHVDVKGIVDPNLSGRVAEAAFQIVKEGLSNILRHTSAKKGFVSINSTETHLLLEIGNETDNTSPIKRFKPQSIHERAFSLNGETLVEANSEGYIVVRVSIPLSKD
jgi:signal transduction histidine kinase